LCAGEFSSLTDLGGVSPPIPGIMKGTSRKAPGCLASLFRSFPTVFSSIRDAARDHYTNFLSFICFSTC
jgi:hypothetical protein